MCMSSIKAKPPTEKPSTRPGRGIIAAVARGIGAGPRAREAAHIALHGLLEGYFGAAATLGPGRAAALAL